MALQAAFIFLAGESNPEEHQGVVETPTVHLHVYAVSTYEQAVELAEKLVEQGITAIELCGGFGNIGTGMIAKAVQGKADVGIVKFDRHPGLDCQSGDSIFL